MEIYLVLSQAVAVLKILRKRVDSRLTLLEDCEDMEQSKKDSIEKNLLNYKEDVLYALSRLENLVIKLRDDL